MRSLFPERIEHVADLGNGRIALAVRLQQLSQRPDHLGDEDTLFGARSEFGAPEPEEHGFASA